MKGAQLAADVSFYLGYSKWNEEKGKSETWKESVARVMAMHIDNPKLKKAFENQRFRELFNDAYRRYEDQLILGSNRALQFGGDPIMKHNSKMYNCLASHADRVEFFGEAMYWLMSGCGIGYSVQYRHVEKLPAIHKRDIGAKIFVVEDSIEGWSDAVGVLISSFFQTSSNKIEFWNAYSRFSEYSGYKIKFDFSQIRPKGSKIAGGFKAPGPDGLKQSLERIETLLDKKLNGDQHCRLDPINIYDIVCHMCDAVLSGGVRRSSSICVFSPNDEDMINAKTFDNYNPKAGINPQRSRSNNSAVLVRKETTREQFDNIIEKTKQWGEPGFYFVDHPDQVPNPCVEIGMWPIAENGRSGWQGCNLVVGNGKKMNTKQDFLDACVSMAVLATVQATYTDFKYVQEESKMIFEREALLGCSIGGWMNSPEILLDEATMREGAQLILDINKEVAEIVGINPSARVTCVKPDGNTGVLLQAASGVHGEEAPYYFRLIQINKESEIAKHLKANYPEIIEESVWSAMKTDVVLFVPIEAKKGSIFKKDLVGRKQLEIVKSIQQNWVEAGTRTEACVQPFLRHNVSNTVQVEDWDEVADYLYENKQYFSGVSFLGVFGSLDFKQAPFTPVLMPEELLQKYGHAVMFVSGLVVDGLHAFDDDLWEALAATMNREIKLEGSRTTVLLKKDWVRRSKQFAKRYFKGDILEMSYCLKQVHLYHKWVEVNRILQKANIDLSKVVLKPHYTEVDTTSSIGCVGGACELPGQFLDKVKE